MPKLTSVASTASRASVYDSRYRLSRVQPRYPAMRVVMGRLGVRRPPSIVVRSNRNRAAGEGLPFVLTPSPAGICEDDGMVRLPRVRHLKCLQSRGFQPGSEEEQGRPPIDSVRVCHFALEFLLERGDVLCLINSVVVANRMCENFPHPYLLRTTGSRWPILYGPACLAICHGENGHWGFERTAAKLPDALSGSVSRGKGTLRVSRRIFSKP